MKNYLVIVVIAIAALLIGCFCHCLHQGKFAHWTHITVPHRSYIVVQVPFHDAGFYFVIYNILCAQEKATQHGLGLAVILNNGLYIDTERVATADDIKAGRDPRNWFHYAFEPLAESTDHFQDLWNRYRSSMISFAQFDTFSHEQRQHIPLWIYDQAAFKVRGDSSKIDYPRWWAKSIHLQPRLSRRIDEFYKQRLQRFAPYVMAIHVRLSDKVPCKDDEEDGPKHFTYEQYCQMADEIGAANNMKALLVCSDEQPFIDYILQRRSNTFKTVVSVDGVFRSPANTGGLTLDTRLCSGDPHSVGYNSETCQQYRALADKSIHRGNHVGISNSRKVDEGVVEVFLMAKCNLFAKSRGNFSNAVTYCNPKIKVIDLVDYESNRKIEIE